MTITPIRTHKIYFPRDRGALFAILDRYLPALREGSVVAVTSKIVSICEGRVIRKRGVRKDALIRREADWFLLPEEGGSAHWLTIKNGVLIPTAGIDESNGAGYYILWPKNPQKTADRMRAHMKKRFGLRRTGVLITDSKTSPLRWGTTGVAIAWSGFEPLKDYIKKPDIFGRKMRVTKANLIDGLAAAAVVAMGEGNEQTPLAVIENAPFIRFVPRAPSRQEIKSIRIAADEDIYRPLLRNVQWQKGRRTSQLF
jgi:putative folate metabolism gamma-glutamate ligase